MPNFVTNVLYGENLSTLPIFSKGENLVIRFDFNKLIPMPEELSIESRSTPIFNLTQDFNICELLDFLKLYNIISKDEDLFDISINDIKKIQDVDDMNLIFKSYSRILFILSCVDVSNFDLQLYRKYENNQRKYGFTTWYTWRNHYWGTEWNAINTLFATDGNTIAFSTAGSAPIPVIRKLSKKYPDIEFKLWYVDEGLQSNRGIFTFRDGLEDSSFASYDVICKDIQDRIEKMSQKIYVGPNSITEK